MSTLFVTYLWHYLAARAIYDELLRPLTGGHIPALVLLGLIGVSGFLLGRSAARRRR